MPCRNSVDRDEMKAGNPSGKTLSMGLSVGPT